MDTWYNKNSVQEKEGTITIKEEEVDLSDYLDFTDAYSQIEHFIEQVYQYTRIHSALGYLTPVEFEQNWLLEFAEEKLA